MLFIGFHFPMVNTLLVFIIHEALNALMIMLFWEKAILVRYY